LPGSKLLTVLLIGLLSAGCGGTPAQSVTAPNIVLPQTYTATGKTWTLTPAMVKTDEELLTTFFENFSNYQGSTDFEGPPTMYATGINDRRFFWLRGSTDEPAWSCIHFEDGEFGITEGTDNAFSQ